MQLESTEPFNIVIAGVGGQGNVLSSRLIAWAAITKGYFATIGETYGAAQRGGSVMSHIRISKEEIGPLIPYHSAHVLLGFEPIEALRVGRNYLNPSSTVIVSTHPVYPAEVLSGQHQYPPVEEVIQWLQKLSYELFTLDAVELAKKAGDPLVMNTVMVGAFAGSEKTPITQQSLREVISSKIRRLEKINLKAFNLGLKALKKKL